MGESDKRPSAQKTYRRKYLTALGGALGVTIAGCASGPEDGGTTTPADTQTTGTQGGDSQTTGTDGTGDTGEKTLTLASFLDPFTLDPHMVADSPTVNAVMQSYDSLVGYDGENNQITPRLATDWKVSSDKTTYTFTLRDDATFHDGSKVTAEDVKFSMDRALAIGGAPAARFGTQLSADSVTAVDETTVEMKLAKPVAPFVHALSWFYVVNPAVVTANEKSEGNYGEHGDYAVEYLNTHSAGSGPFRIANRQTGEQIVYEAYDDYWQDWPDGGYDRAIYRVISEVATLKQSLRDGEADMSDAWMSVGAFEDLMDAGNLEVKQNVGARAVTVHMNTQREPLNDVNVRKGIAYAIDYEGIKSVFPPQSERIKGPLPSTMWGHNPNLEGYTYNPETAQQHFDQASASVDGLELNYHWVAGNTIERLIGLQMQSNLQRYGITLNVVKTPWSKLIGRQTQGPSGAVDMTIFLWIPPYGDPSSLLYQQYHSQFWDSESGTYASSSFYENPEVDALLEEAQRTHDQAVREQNYKQAQELIVNDAPIIPLYNETFLQALKTEIKGYDFVQPYWVSKTQRMNNFHS